MRVGVLTISDACSRGERADASGDLIADWATAQGHDVAARACVPDETVRIVSVLTRWADTDVADLILTTGGTGLAPRDVTPEATRSVISREAPGITESMRGAVLSRTPRAALSRGVAGTRARALIVNLPGSPAGVRDGLVVLTAIVLHAVEIIRGDVREHA